MAQESLQEQMRGDVRRALRKPPEQRHWAMIVDVRKCVGCHACTVACKAENKTPPGVNYRTVKEAEVGAYPNVQRLFMPTLCMQCENPPCVKACKDGSITKGKDGVVRIDYAKNTGDPAVNKACPYGAMSTDDGSYYTDGTPKHEAYEDADTFEYGVEVRPQGEDRQEPQVPLLSAPRWKRGCCRPVSRPASPRPTTSAI